MPPYNSLKAVVLAAGSKTNPSDGSPVLLQELGGKRVIDYVIENVCQLCSPENVYVVVGYHQDAIRSHLGPDYQYVVQQAPRGTGEAVLAIKPSLEGYQGDILILYGDTPLIRTASYRGLINRHQLRHANLTLLSAFADRPYPYGRIVRSDSGQIIDIVEESHASAREKDIRELNLGAYVVSAEDIWQALETQLPLPENQELGFTESVHNLIHAGLVVEAYQIYDQDEIQGINTQADLTRAEFILQKRFFRPRREEENNIVHFGTGGWRALIGEGFTLHNVRRICQALSNEIIRHRVEKRGVLIGYDRRFLSDNAAASAAEVFAGNNIHTVLLSEPGPTPLIEYATRESQAAFGLAFTASHNPPQWNGIKIFHGTGALLMTEETNRIEEEANQIDLLDEVIKIPLDVAKTAGVVKAGNYTNAYIDQVESFVDMGCIREAGLKVIVDPMYGVGHLTLGVILNDARCRVTLIHDRHNPLFGGRTPSPDLDALRLLQAYVRDEAFDLGLATDGDADRIAVVDEQGRYISANDLLLLLYWYLHEYKHQHGAVVRNLATTHMLDHLADVFGEQCFETPVGFKWISASMVEHNALLGGESSGGLTIRGHILGKDGILASILVIEMLAQTGSSLSALLEQAWKLAGRRFMVEANLPATADMRVIIPQKMSQIISLGNTPKPIHMVREDDGAKLVFTDGTWVLLRFSGTEPILRISAEAESAREAEELVGWLKGKVIA